MKKKETETLLPGCDDYLYRGLIKEIERAIANGAWHPQGKSEVEQYRELLARASRLVPDWETHGVTVPYWFWEGLLDRLSRGPRKMSEDELLLLDMSRWTRARYWTVDEAIDAGLIRGVYGTWTLKWAGGTERSTLNRQTDAALAAKKKRRAEFKPLNFNGLQKKKTDASAGLSEN